MTTAEYDLAKFSKPENLASNDNNESNLEELEPVMDSKTWFEIWKNIVAR